MPEETELDRPKAGELEKEKRENFTPQVPEEIVFCPKCGYKAPHVQGNHAINNLVLVAGQI